MKFLSSVPQIFLTVLIFSYIQTAAANNVEKLKKCDDLLNKYDEKLSNYSYSFDREDQDELRASIDELEPLSGEEKVPPELYFCLYGLYVLTEDEKHTLISLNKYISVSEPEPMLYYLSSVHNQEMGNMAEALEQINAGIALNDTLPHYFNKRAEINYELGNHTKALDDVSKEMQIQGGQSIDIDFHFLHAKILMSLKQYERAITVLTDNIILIDSLFPSGKGGYFVPRVENYNLLMKAYCEINDRDTAASVYENTKDYQPQASKPKCL